MLNKSFNGSVIKDYKYSKNKYDLRDARKLL